MPATIWQILKSGSLQTGGMYPKTNYKTKYWLNEMLGCEKGKEQTVIKIYTRDTKLKDYTNLLFLYTVINLQSEQVFYRIALSQSIAVI